METYLLFGLLLFPIMLNIVLQNTKIQHHNPIVFLSLVGFISSTFYSLWNQPHLKITFNDRYFSASLFNLTLDRLSALLILVILIIGAVVIKYSLRHLADDREQKRFLTHLSLTLFSITLSILAENFMLFLVTSIITTTFVSKLLAHFSKRSEALQTAKVFRHYSYFGELLFLFSALIFYSLYGTLGFTELNQQLALTGSKNDSLVLLAAALLVTGVAIKSALFPFHYWLPNTLETPVTVSALMHAGVINAGGYLLLRLSPYLSQFTLLMACLALIGVVTTAYALLAMMTQTNIKKQLAYSTIAQMGFMMMQCGLGAYVAATLHMVGHALYKSHAFLASGSIIDLGKLNRFFEKKAPIKTDSLSESLFSAVMSFGLVMILANLLEIELNAHIGLFILLIVLSLALAQTLIIPEFRYISLGFGLGIVTLYLLSYKGLKILLAQELHTTYIQFSNFDNVLLGLIGTIYLGLYFLQNNLHHINRFELGQKLYVSFYKGLYWGRR